MAESTLGRGQNTLGGRIRTISARHCDPIHTDSALYEWEPAEAVIRSPISRCTVVVALWNGRGRASRFEITGVAMQYGRFATSSNRLPGLAANAPSIAASTAGANRCFEASTSPSTNVTVPFAPRATAPSSVTPMPHSISLSRANCASRGSISAVITRFADLASRSVRAPVPLPTSNTTSSRPMPADRSSRSSRFKSTRKFCPRRASIVKPTCTNNCLRYAVVCRAGAVAGS